MFRGEPRRVGSGPGRVEVLARTPAMRNRISTSDVQRVRLPCPFRDEPVAGARVLAHQVGEGPLGLEDVGNDHLQRAAPARVERRRLQLLGHHLAEALEAHDLRLHVLRELREDRVALRVVERPVRLLPRVDPVERRLGEVDVPLGHELREVPPEERQEEGRDVVPVRVGVHQEEDLAVTELRNVEVGPAAASESRDDVRQLLVPRDLCRVGLLGVQDLAPQGEDRLRLPVAPLLGRTARRVPLHDEELRLGRVGRGAVGELAREVQAVGDRRLACHLLHGRARRLAGARRHYDPADDLLGDRRVLVQPVLEGGADGAVDLSGDLRVVEPLLRLPLELRLEDVDGEEPDEPLADVLGRRADPLRQELVRREVVADRLDEARLQAVLVRASRGGRDTVDVRAEVLVRRLGPLEGDLEARVRVADEDEAVRVGRHLAALGDDFQEVVGEPPVVRVFLAGDGLLRLVDEDDAEAAVEVGLRLEPVADLLRVEREPPEDLRVGPEADGRPAAAHLLGRDLRDLRGRLPLRVRLPPVVPVAPHVDRHLGREGADDRRADAVEAARVDVAPVLELPAGVERREDQLECGLLVLRVDVDGDAAAVVVDLDLAPVRAEADLDPRGPAVDDLVDGVVDDLPDEVVEPPGVDASDVHAGALADRLEPFEDGDVGRGVVGGSHDEPSKVPTGGRSVK